MSSLPLDFPPKLTLLPFPGILTEGGALVVADLHLGKAAALRDEGLGVPGTDPGHDLERLAGLVTATGARRLVIAGDFLHFPTGGNPDSLAAAEHFLKACPVPVDLVLGNHEHKLGPLPESWRLPTHESLEVDGWHIVHDPRDAPAGRPSLSAHWHPVIKLPDGKRTHLRLPCFWWRGANLVLPAAGTCTGGQIIHPKPGDRIFACLQGRVVEIPSAG